ncbi:MAG: hypothetical protein E7511_03155 [Ruminococcus sp.]|nr:hypothetical protein [Ruminococcus sp.]
MKYDFNNPAHWKALEKQAYEGTLDYSRFPPAAYRYFSELMKVYHAYRFEGLDKETAGNRKRKLYAQYREAVLAFEGARDTFMEYQGNIRKAGTLLSDIEKAQHPHRIAVLACEVIGLVTGEKNFAERQKKKIEGVQT